MTQSTQSEHKAQTLSQVKKAYDKPNVNYLGKVVDVTHGPTSGFEDGFGSGNGVS